MQQPPPPSQAAVKPPQTQAEDAPAQARSAILGALPEIREQNVSPAPKEVEVPPSREAEPKQPEYLASMHLVDQAKAALTQGKPDAAVSLLEQAVQVDVYNGEAFYHLARAWRMKGSRQKALEFAKKAEILFQGERKKLRELYLFEAEVYKDLKDSSKAELYRQKASTL